MNIQRTLALAAICITGLLLVAAGPAMVAHLSTTSPNRVGPPLG